MRLAIFSPLPPVASGIADYTADLVRLLATRHEVHAFAASADELTAEALQGCATVSSAHDFPWRQHRTPFDLIVYQMGNAWCHDFMWPYLFRYPGLVVLHDGQLHHARAWSLLRRHRTSEDRAELLFNHPGLPPEAADPAIAGMPGLLYYLWPMLRSVIAASRAVAVHNRRLADDLRREHPGAAVDAIRMGVPGPVATRPEIAAVRARHGVAADAIVVMAFGGITPEKRLGPLMRAASVARRSEPRLRLLFVGSPPSGYDVEADAAAAGVADILTLTGRVAERDIAAYLGAADIVTCLRWPSARETSASWLRALAAGRPTLVTELAQQVDVPTLDPRSWTTRHVQPTLGAVAPVAVGIDVMDEEHSLRLALKRLVTDAALRCALGAEARRAWQDDHTLDVMRADYERVLARASQLPLPSPDLPAHLRVDGLEGARETLAPFGLSLTDVFGDVAPRN